MLFFTIVLGLVALIVADPETKQKIEQEQQIVDEQKQPVLHERQPQKDEDVTVIPFYKQVHYPYTVKMYSGHPGDRDFFGYSQKYGGYSFFPYNHKNVMSYPYSSYSQMYGDYPFPPYNHKNFMSYPYGSYSQKYGEYPFPPYNHKDFMSYPYGSYSQKYEDYHYPPYNHKNFMSYPYGSYNQKYGDYPFPPYNHKNFVSYPYGSHSQKYGDYPFPPFNHKNFMFYPYSSYSQKYGDYQFSPYHHKNFMSYPYMNKYYMNYLNKLQSKVYYDSQDIFDYQDTYDHEDYSNRPLANIPGYSQHHTNQEDLAGSDYSYLLPHSPSYYDQYHQKYPLINGYYGKNLDLWYAKPWTNDNNKLWYLEYMRRYFGRNLKEDSAMPLINRNLNSEGMPVSYDEQNLEFAKPEISRNLDSKFVESTIPIKDMDVALDKPITLKNHDIGSTQKIVSRKVDLEGLRDPDDRFFWSPDYVSPRINVHGRNWYDDY